MSQALGRLGYEVRATSNAATLWQWVSNGEGGLVITDIIMPDENALDLIPRIQKIRPDLKVIAMSAQSTLLTAVRANEFDIRLVKIAIVYQIKAICPITPNR